MTKVEKNKPFLGCIADDFTGASDLASFLVASGMRTVQVNAIPSTSQLEKLGDFDAIVIALKSRTAPVKAAVNDALDALKSLQQLGCQKFYFKYCSTFDSTAQGNIGPVTDAICAHLKEKSTIICPALPVNGRTVYQGHLFVFDQPLHESPMRNHPLTPMTDSSLVRLMEAQGRGKAISIPYEDIEQGADHLHNKLNQARAEASYLIIDCLNTEHLRTIGKAVSQFKFITGGSGLATDLTAEFIPAGFKPSAAQDELSSFNAPTLVLSGSCSAMTNKQVSAYAATHPSLRVDAIALHRGEQTLQSILNWLDEHADQAPLIYSTATTDLVQEAQQALGDNAADLLEATLSDVAAQAAEIGFRNFVVAGGETSGAIVKKLNIDAFQIGVSIAPGVPMVQTLSGTPINLALKSGNFGQEDFFQKAVETLKCS